MGCPVSFHDLDHSMGGLISKDELSEGLVQPMDTQLQPLGKGRIQILFTAVGADLVGKGVTVGPVLENVQLIGHSQVAVGLGHRQRAIGGEHILRSSRKEDRRRLLRDLADQIILLRVSIGDIIPALQDLQQEVCPGDVGGGSGRIAQDHGIWLVLSQNTGSQCQMSSGRETAHGDFVRSNVPLPGIFPDVSNGPGDLLQRREARGVFGSGIPQNKGVKASGRIAQCHRLPFSGRAVYISAAGTDQYGGTVFFQSKSDLTVEKVSLQRCLGMTGDGH